MKHTRHTRIIIGLFICLLLTVLCAFSLADVPVDEEHFPDFFFRKYIKSFANSDSILTDETISRLRYINVSKNNIASLKGIEYLTAMVSLDASDNILYEIDVSGNPLLEELKLNGNRLTHLDVSKNTQLTILWLSNNRLSSLDVSRNTQLTELKCPSNQISSLDVSMLPKLLSLACGQNNLRSLDVTQNVHLDSLWCADNKISSLKLRNNEKLIILNCRNNQIKSLDVSNCRPLRKLVTKYKPFKDDEGYYGWAANYDSDPVYESYLYIDTKVRVYVDGKQYNDQASPGQIADASVTVAGGKYELSSDKKSAVFTGPQKTSAKSLVIQDIVTINGKKYKVTEIASGACRGMSKLTTLTVGRNVKAIGKEAFYLCKKAKTIKILGIALKKIGADAFGSGNSKVTVFCAKKKIKAYTKLLQNAGLSKKAVFKELK